MPAAALAALAELSTIQDRLDGVLDMGQLFRAPVAESLELVRTCKAIAGGWQAHYLAMRERLEASGHPARWEFSRQLLFENTNYAAEVRRLAVGTTAGDCVCDLLRYMVATTAQHALLLSQQPYRPRRLL